MAWIYKLVLKTTGETYIGQTKGTVESRIGKHKLDCSRCPNKFIYKRINEEGGWSNVSIEKIQECFEKDLDILEQKYIKEIDKDLCLNTQHGSRYKVTYNRRPDINWNDVAKDYLNGYSTYDLAKKYNCNNTTIGYNLKKLNVEIRKQQKLSKEFLYKEYILNNKSTNKIAKETNYSSARIKQLLHEYNIPVRHAVYNRNIINN